MYQSSLFGLDERELAAIFPYTTTTTSDPSGHWEESRRATEANR